MKALAILLLALASLTSTMNAQNLQGAHWTARKVEKVYIVSVENRSSILEALTDFVVSQKVRAGQITGIGATNDATLRFFDPDTKKFVDKAFKEQMEIANLTGNISTLDGTPLLHLHVTLGRQDYTALAGHLLDARIRGAGEFYVLPIDADVIKKKNEEVGLNLYDLRD